MNLIAFGGVMAQKPPKSPQKWDIWLLGNRLNLDNLETTNAIYTNETYHDYLSP